MLSDSIPPLMINPIINISSAMITDDPIAVNEPPHLILDIMNPDRAPPRSRVVSENMPISDVGSFVREEITVNTRQVTTMDNADIRVPIARRRARERSLFICFFIGPPKKKSGK